MLLRKWRNNSSAFIQATPEELWFSPVTLTIKLLMQQLWQSGIEWDRPISSEHLTFWKTWSEELPLITSHPIPRQYDFSESPAIASSLHVFTDASVKGYGAVIYMRTVHADTSTIMSLVASSTRVAPMKAKLTIPRLELSAALLGANLLQAVGKDLTIAEGEWYGWTDSAVVLGWLAHSTNKWRVFVSHRVVQFRNILPQIRWRYVPSSDNPADHASRGLMPSQIVNCELWWHGPPWLCLPPAHWPAHLNPVVTRVYCSCQRRLCSC